MYSQSSPAYIASSLGGTASLDISCMDISYQIDCVSRHKILRNVENCGSTVGSEVDYKKNAAKAVNACSVELT